MRRGPIVLGATAAGLAAVLSFHTRTTPPVSLAAPGGAKLVSPPAGTGTNAPTGSTSRPTTTTTTPASQGGGGSTTTTSTAPTTTTTTSPTTTTTTTTSPPATRTATGPLVNYSYGVLSVSVTVTSGKITDVTLASLGDGGNPRSQSIDDGSIPVLEQEAVQAQSADIQAVSGASYTSAGFVQSLQGALQGLGL